MAVDNDLIELQEEIARVGRRVRELKEILNAFLKVSQSILQETKKRVDRIEKTLKLPPIS